MLVINCKPFNQLVKKQKFHMETKEMSKLCSGQACELTQWICSMHIISQVIYWIIYIILDKYWVIYIVMHFYPRIHWRCREQFRFIIEDKVFEFKALPMGLTCCQEFFTRLKKFLCKQGTQVEMVINNMEYYYCLEALTVDLSGYFQSSF